MKDENETSKKILKMLQKLFAEKEKIYIEDKNGEYALTENTRLESIKENIKKIKNELEQ